MKQTLIYLKYVWSINKERACCSAEHALLLFNCTWSCLLPHLLEQLLLNSLLLLDLIGLLELLLGRHFSLTLDFLKTLTVALLFLLTSFVIALLLDNRGCSLSLNWDCAFSSFLLLFNLRRCCLLWGSL